ncbi:tRNA (adenosine(37)-N6)-threonylcarbamoyltransferase complex dimerization subunit type 1 TsaB [Prosthecochloris sp. N3]|uniref:tRNA (Adenosine(37)-N6)-threonylcarbamoyltransferase complex dimerization subunit type 1 TsaB n=1 Tax=Prosthecochloris ethylica TaxID=2743976 RepID=A0ABR9XSR6_9CHLB|nr:tRNA (adenosine(37)-N6)-threonylcarbamoyltransferase complex dimerization subunit type 1 TsaB [Prosthecochloris ethylica]MBF0637081.1 tRNA (adenosine(37)-N6)-threonylcarbamoyltransferase complex dimerization subunit type 1 TsaB [Prosthecochloris ethylica]NUK47318.1 tRNA (adenosine(37)-N6)-threonylcarbamoyltransferase complex dimerization subunit type 1 TsaB [Prosthecochloris ethylica]
MISSSTILAIECSHQLIGAAVGDGEHAVGKTVDAWQKTAESMVPLIDAVLEEAGVGLRDVDALAVSAGPGSFTALRIGMATAKGIAFGAGVPLLPVSTIEALAVSAAEATGRNCVVPLIPARKGEYYYTVWSFSGARDWAALRDVAYAGVPGLEAVLRGCDEDCLVTARSIAPLKALGDVSGRRIVQADFFSAKDLIPLALRDLEAVGPGDLESVVPAYHQQFRPYARG